MKDSSKKNINESENISNYEILLEKYNNLVRSERKYRLLVENGGDGIVVVQDDKVRFVNKEMLALLRIDDKSLAAENFFDYVHPDDVDDVMINHENNILLQQRDEHYRIRAVRNDKTIVWVEIKSVAVEWEGRPASLAFIRDIEKQKRIEDELRQAQKMEAIGTLAGGITHDFNNILTSILGSAELALLDLDNKKEIKDAFELIFESGNRAKDLVAQILTATRKAQSVKVKPINVGTIVKEALKLIRSTFPKNIKIVDKIDDNLQKINADPTQIHQIILNLCTNAVHAMENFDTGVLEIHLENISLNSEFIDRFNNVEPGDYIRLTISDTGHGMDSETQERIFDPYFTTKEQGKGTGFGLATTIGIVRSHNGFIDVESEPLKGSSFFIYFPALVCNSGEEEKPVNTKKIAKGKGNILFVDDEQEIVNLGQRMLTNAGYSVITAMSGKDALGYFKVGQVKIDLMITDMAMPGMTGKKLTRKVLKIKPDLPVILCTGYSEAIDEEKAKEIGVMEYIRKPYELSTLSFIVKKTLEKACHKQIL